MSRPLWSVTIGSRSETILVPAMDEPMAIQRATFQSELKHNPNRRVVRPEPDDFSVRLATQEEFDRYISTFPTAYVSKPNADLSNE
jgi:hypothetical protein